ncbi:hypothetical protein TESG_05522 [Trichophyton tonsurans CBS 112818]|uniref:Uncharacterized protein n=2 Tax=Trichophyton TaxID=5550 RepID=F2PHZ5_TRIEC|nr:hypothetical protein TESG_05522 [Trichophyton tonsurans CBS 112818]EGE01557.1 hypothetical protein TEQG_00603 [Trichophyton equinum CBS 127.97]
MPMELTFGVGLTTILISSFAESDGTQEVSEMRASESGQRQISDEPALPELTQQDSHILEGITVGSRSEYCPFLFTKCENIEKLPEKIRVGVKNSKLWREEHQKGGLSVTNCLSLYLPEIHKNDAFLIIRMGADDGIKISNDFGFGDPDFDFGVSSGMQKGGYKEVMPIGLSQI